VWTHLVGVPSPSFDLGLSVADREELMHVQALPQAQAMGEGYDVYVVTDSSDAVSRSTDMAIRRLVAAGAQPIAWIGMAGELQVVPVSIQRKMACGASSRVWQRAFRIGSSSEVAE
jgi:hypothetical protein